MAIKHVHYTNPNENIKIDFVQMGFHKTPSLHQVRPKVRDHYLLHFVINGTGQLTIKGQQNSPKSGECFLIRPKDLAEYISDQENPWEYYWLGFAGPDAGKVVEESGFSDWSDIIRPTYISEIIDTLQMIDRANLDTDDDIRMIMCQWIMYQVLYYLLKGSSIPEPLQHREMASSKREHVLKAIHIMEADYSQPLTIAHLADRININSNYLSKIFKEEMGMSIKQFLTKFRLGVAATKVRLSRKSFKEIATETGFEDSLYFSKLFKKQYKCSPSEYRKML
ncbi:MAG: AraC family transcriptional regulator [Defluviitaleaceae bacterium]|nr:AraC family transcriptional regulator [Defluviitaleaceae bacterium]